MKYQDIPKFIRPPHYTVNVCWSDLNETLKRYNDRSCDGWLGLNLDPDFQRGHVWTEDKQIAYVEFVIRGGETSRELIFNHHNWNGSYKGEMVLVDGKQRLEAVRKFIRNELAIFNGNYLNDFDYPDRVLRSCDFIFRVNNLPTKKMVLEWYLQLNGGGVVHTKEELDKVRKMLEELNND